MIGAWRRGVDGGVRGVYMAKILLAASVVEAAGESSRLALPYLQHYATGVYKGVYLGKIRGRTRRGNESMSTYARRGGQEQYVCSKPKVY